MIRQQRRHVLWLICALLSAVFPLRAQKVELNNGLLVAVISSEGLASLRDLQWGSNENFSADRWSLQLDEDVLKSGDAHPVIRSDSSEQVTLTYVHAGYTIEAIYRLQKGWHFVSKQLRVIHAPHEQFMVRRIVPVDIVLTEPVQSRWVPSTYLPQLGATPEKSRRMVPAKDFAAFLRLQQQSTGLMLLVQNPFLDVQSQGESASLGYNTDMQWQNSWGQFASDLACIGLYQLSGQTVAPQMELEWNLPPAGSSAEGMDFAEIAAFRDCVRSFLVEPSPSPISLEVGWTLNDYQIDVATSEGKAEYKKIIDATAGLGIHSLLYAPTNSNLANLSEDTDAWHWEHTLWLNLGQQIRKGTWDPAKSPIPADVSEMVSYAKSKNVGLLAYVYPSIPFEKDASWIVAATREGSHRSFATLASRDLQDYLIRQLVAFEKRTGIAGYSFDYTWLDLPGNSAYAQWWGWRRVIESLRRENPAIVIDGRQSYQQYGPWSWLAGSYPHPTGNDEQPENFTPYPDLHFDRVSGDRARFVNYWYRNYQFAPQEIIPGYATHQTERSRNVPPDSETGGHPQQIEMMQTAYRLRDWDYLGFRYSFLSSIATGGWNNVVDMIPARDPEEARNFSAEDKAWIRDWLSWTVSHKQYLVHTRNILGQPAMGRVDGTAAVTGNRGYLFLFNPNYKALPAVFKLDSSIGITSGEKFVLRELYPRKGRILGKEGAGLWSRGDTVQLPLDGTSATAVELIPASAETLPLVFNTNINPGAKARLVNGSLVLDHVAGEPGTDQEIGVMVPQNVRIMQMVVNGIRMRPEQTGGYVSCHLHFEGVRFAQAQQVTLSTIKGSTMNGSFLVPQRILDQLAARRKTYPIPWTKQDHETTWLVPERLLLFVQMVNPKDTMQVQMTLDGHALQLCRAYTSVRAHARDFVGFYADLSAVVPNVRHTLQVEAVGLASGQLQGVFFDNVEPETTETISVAR